MIVAGFDEAMTLTLGHEGGWYAGNDPRDPNPTMFGVIQVTYDRYRDDQKLPRQSVKFIARDELKAIYRQYWDGTCEPIAQVAPLTALCLFDMSINAGPITARRILQRALDLQDDGHLGDLQDDGKIGPRTMVMVKALGLKDDESLCRWLLLERFAYYDDLTEMQRLRPNLKSWVRRTSAFYRTYIRP